MSFAGKNVLITGGVGFIGSNLARRLVREGANVTLLDSMLDEYGANLFNIKDIKDDVVLNFSDMRDEHSLRYLVRDKDYIFNLAGQVYAGALYGHGGQYEGTAYAPGDVPLLCSSDNHCLFKYAADLWASAVPAGG